MMTLDELATRSGIASAKIKQYLAAGLLPCKLTQSEFSSEDQYWLDMVNCFVENGSTMDDLKDLMPLCEESRLSQGA